MFCWQHVKKKHRLWLNVSLTTLSLLVVGPTTFFFIPFCNKKKTSLFYLQYLDLFFKHFCFPSSKIRNNDGEKKKNEPSFTRPCTEKKENKEELENKLWHLIYILGSKSIFVQVSGGPQSISDLLSEVLWTGENNVFSALMCCISPE